MSTVMSTSKHPSKRSAVRERCERSYFSSGTFTCSPLIPHGPILRRIIITTAITFEHSIPGEANQVKTNLRDTAFRRLNV